MDEKFEKIEEILELFDEREELWREYNEMIADRIMSTTLAALYELFGLPVDSVEWVDLQIAETALVVVCSVSYDSTTELSPFLKKLDEATDTPIPVDVQRILRIAIPIASIFSPKEEIKEFLMGFSVNVKEEDEEINEKQHEKETPIQHTDAGFDRTKLSKEQIEQLLFFQQTIKGTKQ